MMKPKLLRIIAVPLFAVLLFGVVVDAGIFAVLFTVPFTLVFGWPCSIVRSFKALHPQLGAVILFLLATTLLVAGTHVFLRWLNSTFHNGAAETIRLRWRWKWTICGYGIVLCTLIAIGSAVLTVHQIYWISKSTDPLLAYPFREQLEVMGVAMDLQQQAEQMQWNSSKNLAAFLQHELKMSPGEPALEALQPVWIGGADGRDLRAIILVPRRHLHRRMDSIFVIQPGTRVIKKSKDKLPQVLASFGIGASDESAKAQTAFPQ